MSINADNMKNFSQWLNSILLGIVSWLFVTTWGNISKQLYSIQANVLELQIQVAQLQATQLTEAKVREICETEILKHSKEK